MILRHAPWTNDAVDHRAGAAAVGHCHQQGHAAVLAAAWIETLHNRAERKAERHLRTA